MESTDEVEEKKMKAVDCPSVKEKGESLHLLDSTPDDCNDVFKRPAVTLPTKGARASQVKLPQFNTESTESAAQDKVFSEGQDKESRHIVYDTSGTMKAAEDNLVSSDQKNGEKSQNKKEKSNKTTQQMSTVDIPYTEPSWGAKCTEHHYLEVIKGGCVMKTIDLDNKSFFIVGRLDNCDIKLEHPSSSRYHAVLQYKGALSGSSGFYLFDLGSTHGTFVNKVQVQPKKYFRLRVGFVIKFGGSSRLYILQGPDDLQDSEEADMQIENKSTQEKKDNSTSIAELIDDENDIKEEESGGIDWGMGEDAVEEETDIEKLLEQRKPLELKDPKKTLRGFFEREGLELEYESEDKVRGSSKSFVIKVRLPIETPFGEDLYAEAEASKKKDAVLACATRACHILDAHEMLRNAEHESVRAKRRKKLEEDDFYDSDDDNFLDRTGSVERKRKRRMQIAGKRDEENVESYESLTKKAEDIQSQMNKIVHRIEELTSGIKMGDEEDELEAYMRAMNSKVAKDAIGSQEKELQKLKKEKLEIDRLIEFCKPVLLPGLKSQERTTNETEQKDKGKDPVVSENKCMGQKDFAEQQSTAIDEKNISREDNFSFPLPDIDKSHAPVVESSSRSSEKSESGSFAMPAGIKRTRKKKKVYGAPTMHEAAQDIRFSDWTPPEGQTGDGHTKLNEKYGY